MENLTEATLIIWSTPLYAGLILIEILISNYKQQSSYTLYGTIENIYLSLLNAGLDLLCRGVSVMILTFFFMPHGLKVDFPTIYWISLVVGLDFAFYLLHLTDHKCRLFWAIHVTHHSSEEFNFTVGFRSSVFQPMYRFIYFIPLALVGFLPADILIVYSASQIYGILLHTKWVGKLGPLEWILATPSHHRVHHGSNPEYLDKNMGMLLIIWDRLFGTFQEEGVAVKYGITKKLKDHHPKTVVFHEWHELINDLREIESLNEKVAILFGPPGLPKKRVDK